MSQIPMVCCIILPRHVCADPVVAAPAEAGQKEIFSSWALFILITLLILALFTSYILQSKKIQAVHETVISIIAGRQTMSHPTQAHQARLLAYRNVRRPHHQGVPRECHTGQRHVQLPILLQLTTTAYHSRFWLRIAPGQQLRA